MNSITSETAFGGARLLITSTGKHPPEKWAKLTVDEIIEVSADAPPIKVKEAEEFRQRLVEMLTARHQYMMEHEQDQIKKGRHDLNLPYETEDYSKKVVAEICDLAKGYSFGDAFKDLDFQEKLEVICNRNFKSAKLVERNYFHSEAKVSVKKKGRR